MDPCNQISRDSSTNLPPFDCLLFDLDDTLYSSQIGIAESCRKNIDDFLVEKCGFPKIQATSLRVELFKTYGSTLAGLRALGYDISADDYHSFVHGRLPYDNIKPDYQLRSLLHTITQRKLIFTNSDRAHAVKVLKKLGLEDCFEQIICFETLNPNLPIATRPDEFPVVLKPSTDAFRIAVEAAKINPRRTLFLDDSVRNITAGKALGLRTVLVGKAVRSAEADYAIETVINLSPEAVPEIWIQSKDDRQQTSRRSRSDRDASMLLTNAATTNITTVGA